MYNSSIIIIFENQTETETPPQRVRALCSRFSLQNGLGCLLMRPGVSVDLNLVWSDAITILPSNKMTGCMFVFPSLVAVLQLKSVDWLLDHAIIAYFFITYLNFSTSTKHEFPCETIIFDGIFHKKLHCRVHLPSLYTLANFHVSNVVVRWGT